MTSSTVDRIATVRKHFPASASLIAVTARYVTARSLLLSSRFWQSRVQEAASKQGITRKIYRILWHFIEVCKANKAKKPQSYFSGSDSLKISALDQLAQSLVSRKFAYRCSLCPTTHGLIVQNFRLIYLN